MAFEIVASVLSLKMQEHQSTEILSSPLNKQEKSKENNLEGKQIWKNDVDKRVRLNVENNS